MPAKPHAKAEPNAAAGCLTIIVLAVIIAVIVAISNSSGGGNSGRTPARFTVSEGAVARVVRDVINSASDSPGLASGPIVSCLGRDSCKITYTVKEPTGVSTDLELIQPTAQIWKALFEDRRFQQGAIEVDGPVTSVGGKSSNAPLFSLSCDRGAASQIDWDNVDGNGLRTLCSYSKLATGL